MQVAWDPPVFTPQRWCPSSFATFAMFAMFVYFSRLTGLYRRFVDIRCMYHNNYNHINYISISLYTHSILYTYSNECESASISTNKYNCEGTTLYLISNIIKYHRPFSIIILNRDYTYTDIYCLTSNNHQNTIK